MDRTQSAGSSWPLSASKSKNSSLGANFDEQFMHQACERLRHHACCVHPDYDGDPPLDDSAAIDCITSYFDQVGRELLALKRDGLI